MNVSDALNNRMNFLIARQAVIAGNIANADTPGYAAQDVEMKTNAVPTTPFAMAVTRASHLSASDGSFAGSTRSESYRFVQHNGNAVRLDEEMIRQNETNLNYRLMTQLYSKQAQLQKMALGRGQ